MKKIIRTFLCLLFAFVITFTSDLGGGVSSFYFSVTQATGSIDTGSVGLSIENLKITDGRIDWTEESENLNDGIVRINKSVTFSFSIKNSGRSDIEYTLSLQLAWDSELSESGKLLVYPDIFDDGLIYDNVKNGILDDAIVSAELSDDTEVLLSTGARDGMSQDIDSGVLNAFSSVDFSYKLFLYEDSDVADNPVLYHNKAFEVVVDANSGLPQKETLWTATNKKFFRLRSVIDTIFPVISEVELNKTFFVSQTAGIDLKSYATAYDTIDGDITNDVSFSSHPQFNPNKAGVYTVTYNVTNSLGNAAAPLQLHITVWDFVKIESGNYHTVALTSHGKVYTWGFNINGQLGDGTNIDKSTPVLLSGLNHIVDIAAGTGCSFALASDGQAYSWGRNENGRLGDGTTTARNKPVKVLQPEGVAFVQISSKFATTGGVTANGDVYTWGYGGYGAAGTGSTGDNNNPTKINLTNIAKIDMGYYNGTAVSNEGILYTWGDNLHGQLGNGANMAVGTNAPAEVPYFKAQGIKVSEASAGYYHMAAVTEDGNLYTWGYGYEGRLGLGTTSDKNIPQAVSMAEPVKKAVAAYYHTGILTTNGEVYFCGQNAYGKHGSGNTTTHLSPFKLDMSGINDISLGYDSSFVLTGISVYGMGYGGTGVLGTGNNSNSTTPSKWAFTPPNQSR